MSKSKLSPLAAALVALLSFPTHAQSLMERKKVEDAQAAARSRDAAALYKPAEYWECGMNQEMVRLIFIERSVLAVPNWMNYDPKARIRPTPLDDRDLERFPQEAARFVVQKDGNRSWRSRFGDSAAEMEFDPRGAVLARQFPNGPIEISRGCLLSKPAGKDR